MVVNSSTLCCQADQPCSHSASRISQMGAEAEFLDAERPLPWIVQDSRTASADGVCVCHSTAAMVAFELHGIICQS